MDQQLTTDIAKLEKLLAGAALPDDLRVKGEEMLARLSRQAQHGNYASDFEQIQHYIDWVTHLPWSVSTQDILDLGHVKQILDSHHFGLEDLKHRFLEYMSVLVLNERQNNVNFHAPVLLLVGLVGTGKTTIAKSISEAMGRKFIRIPFGGMSSALDLRGQSRVQPDAEPGQIIKGLRRAGSKNPVILLDEIDRVADSSRGEIMGVLVELLDPEQNNAFTDHFIDFPFDLSQALFIATANNTTHINTAVMDRLEPILMPSYTDEEKIVIAKRYLLPQLLNEAGMNENQLIIQDEVWSKMVRPLGYDAGIRTLQRTLKGATRKAARIIVEKGFPNVVITSDNSKIFLPQY